MSDPSPIRILVVDDHQLIRVGITSLIQSKASFATGEKQKIRKGAARRTPIAGRFQNRGKGKCIVGVVRLLTRGAFKLRTRV